MVDDELPRDFGAPIASNGIPLVTLSQAVQHLRLLYTDADLPIELADDLQHKIIQASDTIYDYLKSRADPTWDEDSCPPIVQAAVLFYLAHLWEHRGDDMSAGRSATSPDDGVWSAIGRLLMRARDPALA